MPACYNGALCNDHANTGSSKHLAMDLPDLSRTCLLMVGVKYQHVAICLCPLLLLLQPNTSIAQPHPQVHSCSSVVAVNLWGSNRAHSNILVTCHSYTTNANPQPDSGTLCQQISCQGSGHAAAPTCSASMNSLSAVAQSCAPSAACPSLRFLSSSLTLLKAVLAAW
jgi:hypothetical protein